MALNSEVDKALKRRPATAGHSASGEVATLPTANLTARQLQELIEAVAADRHEVALVAGVLTIRPRT